MVLLHLLPWFKRNSQDGYRAVNRRKTKILLSTKRKGWFLKTLLFLSIMAIIPIWVHLRFDLTELKIINFAELKNNNGAELKNANIAQSKREDDDNMRLFDPNTGRLVPQAIRLDALRPYNLATIRNRHFAALKNNNLAEAPGGISAPPTVSKFTYRASSKIKNIAKSEAVKVPKRNTELKYILQWTSNILDPLSYLKTGQKAFIETKCPYTNCYITNNRLYLGADVTKFDAVIFNGRNFKTWSHSDLPEARSPHQKYIFMNLESSDNQPICNPVFDGFFNWTATYKLKSDILNSFFIIKNMACEEVGPRINMNWIENMSEVNINILETIKKKTKAAAWFVSHCTTRCKREKYVEILKNELALNTFLQCGLIPKPFRGIDQCQLKDHNLTLDIYGKCGDLKCLPKRGQDPCQSMLRVEYFFYLAFENSCVEDYVSEKVLLALKNTVVPIVYGGYNYTRFLPPGSFIDARLYKPSDLASIMAGIIAFPGVYSELFKWRNHYKYESRVTDNMCGLCTALNDRTKVEMHTVYKDFRSWWNPDYKERCQDETWGT